MIEVIVKVLFSAVFLGMGYDCLEWAHRRWHEGLTWRWCACLALVWLGVALLPWA